MMENDHSRRHRRIHGIIDGPGIQSTKNIFSTCVNQDNNLPILWRFPAFPIPSVATIKVVHHPLTISSGSVIADFHEGMIVDAI